MTCVIVIQVLFILANISMAIHHANLINSGKKVLHGLWAAIYIAFAVVLSYSCGEFWLLFIALMIRKVVFDAALNVLRNLPVFYVTPEIKGISFWQALWRGKLNDWLHYKVFGERNEVYVLLYATVIIFINVKLL